MEWKWTLGEPYERSRRQLKSEIKTAENVNQDAYSSALNHDENTWDILNQSLANEEFKVSSKREELDTKIADRDMLKQIGYNPFLGENSYVENVAVRDQFLKPQNTSTDKKNIENENQH
uniref:Uncharacterized protein n=1 Tax=viral metagenome TaxID=1070528 RepID=A0A6C0LKQ1_9ZZZZ